jgi:hypothetical protein
MASISAAAPATRRRNDASAWTVVAARVRLAGQGLREAEVLPPGLIHGIRVAPELLEELSHEAVVVDARYGKTGHGLNLLDRWSAPQTPAGLDRWDDANKERDPEAAVRGSQSSAFNGIPSARSSCGGAITRDAPAVEPAPKGVGRIAP